MIAFFTFNRMDLAIESLRTLQRQWTYDPMPERIVIWDDGSAGSELERMKSHIDGDTRIELKEKSETRVNPTSIQEGASRIAEQRRRAVEYFMNDDEKEEFLLFSDSDVFYGSNVLAEMTRD